ncbi:MAG: two-component regulator propeller domain-containing protein [Bacteroidota bacterium]
MSRQYILLLFSVLFFVLPSNAQEPLKIGQWRSHLPFQFGRYITQSSEQVYYTTDWAVLALDKEELSVSYISKINGLSEAGTQFVKYDQNTEKLIVTYNSGVFDLVEGNDVRTFTNIKTDGNFFNREINDINLLDNGRIYFATSFGVVEFDIDREEFGFTANLDINVTGVARYGSFFYAATEEGIYRAPDDPNLNLKDISNWQLLGGADGFPDLYKTLSIITHNNQLFFDINNILYAYDGQDLDSIYFLNNHEIRFLTAEGEHLLAGAYCLNGCEGRVLSFDDNNQFTRVNSSCVDRPLYAVEDQMGQLWYADGWRDVRMAPSISEECMKMKFNSPYTHEATDIVIQDGIVCVATEPTKVVPNFTTSGFFKLEDGQWETFNKRFVEAFVPDNLLGFYRLAIHPDNGKIYAGTMWKGLVEVDGEDVTVFKEPYLTSPSGDPNVIRVSGLDFDRSNNLWVANHASARPVAALLADGETWKNDFNVPSNLSIRQTLVDNFGNKWFTIDGTSNGLLIFNEGEMDDPLDDQISILNTGNSSLPTNRVNCLAVDLDGDVWVGTSEGAVVFECGSNVFDPNCRGSRRIVEVGGFNAYLLEDENVLTIAIDGANRKWFGTESGVFVQSANAEEQIAFFNEDNSPLFDNVVFDIAINPTDGEVFIGTAKGLISLRTDATEGSVINSSNVYAFPNPVRPDYEGPIAIKGLARDADVKITDVSGQLVFQTRALGGQAIWDGRDYNGRKANSGVYLVFSTSTQNSENPDAIVTKILLMN